MHVLQLQMGNVACTRQQIIHERPNEQLPLRIVGQFFQQSTTQPLHSAAVDLSVYQHRIYDHAAVVR